MRSTAVTRFFLWWYRVHPFWRTRSNLWLHICSSHPDPLNSHIF